MCETCVYNNHSETYEDLMWLVRYVIGLSLVASRIHYPVKRNNSLYENVKTFYVYSLPEKLTFCAKCAVIIIIIIICAVHNITNRNESKRKLIVIIVSVLIGWTVVAVVVVVVTILLLLLLGCRGANNIIHYNIILYLERLRLYVVLCNLYVCFFKISRSIYYP